MQPTKEKILKLIRVNLQEKHVFDRNSTAEQHEGNSRKWLKQHIEQKGLNNSIVELKETIKTVTYDNNCCRLIFRLLPPERRWESNRLDRSRVYDSLPDIEREHVR